MKSLKIDVPESTYAGVGTSAQTNNLSTNRSNPHRTISTNQQSPSNKWNDKIEATVKSMGDTAIAYKWMHMFEARRNTKKYNLLMYTGIFLGPLAGILSGVNASIEYGITAERDHLIFNVLIAIFSFFSGIIISILKFGKYDDSSSSHKSAAAKYTSFISNIKRQLSLYRSDRENSFEYLQWLSCSYDEIFSSSPLITTTTISIYSTYSKNHGLPSIDQTNNIIINVSIDDELKDFHTNQTIDEINIQHTPPSTDRPMQIEITNDAENKNAVHFESQEIPEHIQTIISEKHQGTISPHCSIGTPTIEKMTVNQIKNNGSQKNTPKFNRNSTKLDLNRYDDAKMKYEMKRFYNNSI